MDIVLFEIVVDISRWIIEKETTSKIERTQVTITNKQTKNGYLYWCYAHILMFLEHNQIR